MNFVWVVLIHIFIWHIRADGQKSVGGGLLYWDDNRDGFA